MTAELERYLWDRVPEAGSSLDDYVSVRDTINQMVTDGLIQRHKQAWATLEKWASEGAYDYGVTLDLGWRAYDGKVPKRLRA